MSTKIFTNVHVGEIHARLMNILGLQQKSALAKLLGISIQTLNNRESRGVNSLDDVELLCNREGLRKEWVFSGKGEPQEQGGRDYGTIGKEPAEVYDFNGGKRVGVYALAGAGAPTDLVGVEPLEKITIPKDFYRPSIITIKVRGKSMEPLIRDGAYVGIDREDRQIVSGEIYAVWLPYEGAVIKRLYLDMEKITLKSDNPQFPEISVPLQGIDDNFIQGRVRWVIQML